MFLRFARYFYSCLRSVPAVRCGLNGWHACCTASKRVQSSSSYSYFLAGKQQLLDQGNSLPKLEEDLRLSLSDNEKITSLWEEIKTHERLLQEKVDKRVEEERRLKVTRRRLVLVAGKGKGVTLCRW